MEFSPWRLYELTDKIRTLWADHLRYGSITLFYVNPQPCEVAGPRSLVVLVVIESPDDMNVDVRNVLVIQRGPRHLPLRPAPYGAKIFTDLSHRDALVQLDMHKYCKPFRMRDCMIRLGFNVMEADHRYEVNHGMLCTVRVEENPELVQRASEMIDRVEDFYLQVEEVQNMEGSVHQVICHVHGITPENRPLGWRQLVLEGDDLLHLDWIDQLRQLWPFASQDARIVFCTMATDDLREADQIRFHFVVDYGAREGVPILVRQQILAAQTMPQQNEGASEFWAITVMEGAVSAELFTALAIYPFWFASAMRQNVRPHIHVNGRRMEGLQSMWQHGDFVHIRLQVWRVHHMLSILLNDGDEVQTDDVVEHTSFLQLRSGLKHRDGPLAEICAALKSCEEPERESKSMHFSVHHQYDVANPEHGTCRPEGRWDDIAELQSLLRNVLSRGHEGINEDFADIPSLHPHAQIACLLSHAHSDKSPVYHVFTDGSCKHDRATWAITILQQHDLHGRNIFHRVGYAAGCVSDDLGQFDPTAMDAEATAIIAMAEFALGQCFHQAITVYCHFDALVVGFGATGEYNIPMQHGSHSQRQKMARIIMTILESKAGQMDGSTFGIHVKAHQGHPWNEMSDSIAKAVWHGWRPPAEFVFRSGPLLRHSLAEWAWIEVAPTAELPDLRTILRNDRPNADKGRIDSTLTISNQGEDLVEQSATLVMATVNVGTLKYGSGDGQGVSWKVVELLHQIEHKGIHIVGVQESRARASGCVEMGPFTRIIAAGERGQAGVELWLNRLALGRLFGIDVVTDKDLCTWHADKRALAVRCSLGSIAFDVMVLYAPQRGRGLEEISTWWTDIHSMMRKRDAAIPLFCLGDFNASVGSVNSDECGDHAWDVEDESGAFLREFAMKWDLLIPSTFSQYHEGTSATFTSPLGHHSRIDYILLSKDSQSGVLRTYVDTDIDILNGDRDHRPLVMEIGMQWKRKHDARFVRMQFYDREAARMWNRSGGQQILDSLPVQPWSMDVDAHWAGMRQHLQIGAANQFPRQKRKPRQLYFSERTWKLLCDRKDLRQQHREIHRSIQRHLLRMVFEVWRSKGECEAQNKLVDWDLALLRQQAAVIMEARCNIDAKFRACKKQDWKDWVQEQLDRKISTANHFPNDALFKILQPKKMIAKHAGKLNKPMPGYKDMEGEWKFSRSDIASAWQRQFAEVENAHTVTFQELMGKSEPVCIQRQVRHLQEIPTLLDVEKALRRLDTTKAPGLDGLGAELFQGHVAQAARRIYPMVLKMGLRCQGVPELTGGWLLPLFKGRGSAQAMRGYRAILLEPVVARAISRAWRPNMVRGLCNIAQPMQWGGRSGLSIESLHLQVKMWQAQARQERVSQALLFIDIKSAFYTVVKEMLTGGSTEENIRKVFHRMRLPTSVWEQFKANVNQENTVMKSTNSQILADNTRALLQHTWFIIPDAHCIQSPATGSRPGDPGADVLFSLIMSRIMGQIHERATHAGMPLYFRDAITGQPIARCVTWVDDLAVSVCASAEQVVNKAIHMMSIIQEVMLEHGMVLTTGVGKTAVIFAFHGEGSTAARQNLERNYKDGLPILSEHNGCVMIPLVAHYKHLGGHITRVGSCLQEIRVRGANALAKLQPLNKLLKNVMLDMEKKRLLVKSIGLSVLTLHAGTWNDLTQGEYEAWQAGVFKVYQQIQPRDVQGNVRHLQLFELASDMESPLPMELLYVQRLRLLFHIMQVADEYMIGALLHNHVVMQERSWLYGAMKAVNWMRRQIGDMLVPEEVSNLQERQTWEDFRPFASTLKRNLKKAQKSHLFKIRAYLTVKKHSEEQDQMLREMGWVLSVNAEQTDEDTSVCVCGLCRKEFPTEASLAVHQQRAHGLRMAMRRFAVDSACRICKRFFHTRPRLLRHLHMGTTGCWIEQCRRFVPMTVEEAESLDERDRQQGVAMHQSGLVEASVDGIWRVCEPHELQTTLSEKAEYVQSQAAPTTEELALWSTYGMLPPGRGGRNKTLRKPQEMQLCSLNRAMEKLEQGMLGRVQQWQPCFDWIPRPLSCGQRYFLIFFSGHRRFADIASWMEWQGSVCPISIDLAISKTYGNLQDDSLWRQLIQARKVVGAHAAPPCETYTLARWIEVHDGPAPQPLRDMDSPWGKDGLTIQEVIQCFVGTQLMMKALALLLLTYCYGGSFTLEHPKGAEGREGRWTIWDSAMIKQLLLLPDVKRVDFVQGPLGQPFTKPTSILTGRLMDFAQELFKQYQPGWRPTEWLGGRESGGGGWKTAKAKAYPPRMCQVIAETHLRHAESMTEEGHEPDPEMLEQALLALSPGFDPYLWDAKGTEMTNDYWRGKF